MPRRQVRGAAALELALSLPLLIGTFCCVIDLSLLMSQWHVVERAARDGAKAGAITIEGPGGTGAEIRANAIAQAQRVLDASGRGCEDGCTIDARWETDLTTGYRFIEVDIVSPFEALTGVLPMLNDDIKTSFSMMTQQQ